MSDFSRSDFADMLSSEAYIDSLDYLYQLGKYAKDTFKPLPDIAVNMKGYQVVTPHPELTDYINQIRKEVSMSDNIFANASPNAPMVTNSNGASESGTNLRFDLIPSEEIATIAAILIEGAIKYGEYNWKGITTMSHINHALQHIFAYISGDRSDDHLGHAATRLMFAMWTAKHND